METPQQMPMDICIFIKSVKSLCLTDSNVECHSIFTPHAYILDDDEAVRKRMITTEFITTGKNGRTMIGGQDRKGCQQYPLGQCPVHEQNENSKNSDHNECDTTLALACGALRVIGHI